MNVRSIKIKPIWTAIWFEANKAPKSSASQDTTNIKKTGVSYSLGSIWKTANLRGKNFLEGSDLSFDIWHDKILVKLVQFSWLMHWLWNGEIFLKHTYTHIHTHVCTHTHKHTHTNTYTHTHTHWNSHFLFRYTTKHLQDDSTPKNIKSLLADWNITFLQIFLSLYAFWNCILNFY